MRFNDEGKILFAKVRKDAKIPSKREEDGCYDVYPCLDEPCVIIYPNEIKTFNSGIASVFSDRYVAICQERGSTGSKCMSLRCRVIDSGYRGEWFIPINNTGNKPIVIYKENMLDAVASELANRKLPPTKAILYPASKAIMQFALVEVPKVKVEEVKYEELLKYTSERGEGKLGSSNK